MRQPRALRDWGERGGDRGSGKGAGSRRDKEILQKVLLQTSLALFAWSSIFPPNLLKAIITLLLSSCKAIDSLYAVVVAGRRGHTVLTLCSVWGKWCSGRTRQHRRTHPHSRNRRSPAPSVRGGACEPGRRCRCWGQTGHSLKEEKIYRIKHCASCHGSLAAFSFSFYGSI